MVDFRKFVHIMQDGTKIYEVDGLYIRNNIDVAFMQGGHGYVYKYIPKDEIWVERMISPEDQQFNMFHEVIEYQMMRYDKFKYSKAHKIALKEESEKRRGR